MVGMLSIVSFGDFGVLQYKLKLLRQRFTLGACVLPRVILSIDLLSGRTSSPMALFKDKCVSSSLVNNFFHNSQVCFSLCKQCIETLDLSFQYYGVP